MRAGTGVPKVTALVACLVAALLLLAGLSSVASAHTPATFVFSNKVEDTKIISTADGTGKQAHHVLNIPGAGVVTCDTATFEGTAAATKVTTITVKATYNNCTLGGVAAAVGLNGCEFKLGADGTFQITSAPGKNCNKEPMSIVAISGCGVVIGEQVLSGLTFTNINPSGKNEEVTMAMAVPKISGTNGFMCTSFGPFVGGEYETGNTILTGEQDPGAGLIPMKWVATVP